MRNHIEIMCTRHAHWRTSGQKLNASMTSLPLKTGNTAPRMRLINWWVESFWEHLGHLSVIKQIKWGLVLMYSFWRHYCSEVTSLFWRHGQIAGDFGDWSRFVYKKNHRLIPMWKSTVVSSRFSFLSHTRVRAVGPNFCSAIFDFRLTDCLCSSQFIYNVVLVAHFMILSRTDRQRDRPGPSTREDLALYSTV